MQTKHEVSRPRDYKKKTALELQFLLEPFSGYKNGKWKNGNRITVSLGEREYGGNETISFPEKF